MRIAIIGNGKMAKAVADLATERGHTIHTTVHRLEKPAGGALTKERLSGADVAVEFTRPDAVVANLERLIELGIPTVTGTTGWTDALPRLTTLVAKRGGGLLHSPNFSVGVHLFFRAARELARSFKGRPDFVVSILEEHHAAKVDAPSGTALLLGAWYRSSGRASPLASRTTSRITPNAWPSESTPSITPAPRTPRCGWWGRWWWSSPSRRWCWGRRRPKPKE